MRATRLANWLPLIAICCACVRPQSPPRADLASGSGATPLSFVSNDAPASEQDWCEHALAGRPGSEPKALALSSLHANVRFFGVHNRYSAVDRALVAAIGPGLDAGPLDLVAFARALPGACALAALDRHLGPARVERLGDVAWVRPGDGEVAVPGDARALVVDLRDLAQPTTPDEWIALRSALERAVAPALARAVQRPTIRMRHHRGLADECFSADSIYSDDLVEHEDGPIRGATTHELPLAVLTESRMPNEAALLAGTLRLARRAWIYGVEVFAGSAESRWSPVGSQGLVWRYEDLLQNHERWPDRIPADSAMTDPQAVAKDLLSKTTDPPGVTGPAQRGRLDPIANAFGDRQASDYARGTLQAALLSAHGAARTFFAYLGTTVQPAELDARLLTMLDTTKALPVLDAVAYKDTLLRFAVALKQQHANVIDGTGGTVRVRIPVYLEAIDGLPVVRRSHKPTLRPGDAIVAVDGRPIADILQAAAARTPAATEGNRLRNEMATLLRPTTTTTFSIRDLHGRTRDVSVTPPLQGAPVARIREPSERHAGFLTDLGNPALYYINLDGAVLTSHDQVVAAMKDAKGARGLVLDMRGYPGDAANEVVARVMVSPFADPQFWIPECYGPDVCRLPVFDVGGTGSIMTDPSYRGPVALLVGPATVSWAEDIAMSLVDAHRVTVVGQVSGGDDGNNTCLQLPGGFGFSFTGMATRHADGTPFEGIGIRPDVPVKLRAADFAAGRDPELLAAIEALRKSGGR